MKKLLIKPFVFLLIVGLLGCTTTNTKWAALVQTEDQIRNPHIRVTLIDESQFELYYVIVTRETISGFTNNDRPFSVSMDEVRTIEVDIGREVVSGPEVNAGDVAVFLLFLPLLLLVLSGPNPVG